MNKCHVVTLLYTLTNSIVNQLYLIKKLDNNKKTVKFIPYKGVFNK